MKSKNINAIEKIIKELVKKDFLMANPLDKNGMRKHKHKPYSLSQETLDVMDVKRKYLNDEMSEEEYKTYCLHYNLRTARG